MQKIYLVKKNPNSRTKDTDWIIMNQKEFLDFLRTDLAKNRYFIHIEDDIDKECPRIVCECTEAEYKKWISEKWHKLYILRTKKDMGYTVESYNACISDDGEFGEELLIDEYDFTYDLINKLAFEQTVNNMAEDELLLLNKLVLSENTISERKLEAETKIPQKTINNRKRKILKHLKEIFQD